MSAAPATVDYAHTPEARHRRFTKAAAILEVLQRGQWTFRSACRLTDQERRIVARCAGYKAKPSEETWTIALRLLKRTDHREENRGDEQ